MFFEVSCGTSLHYVGGVVARYDASVQRESRPQISLASVAKANCVSRRGSRLLLVQPYIAGEADRRVFGLTHFPGTSASSFDPHDTTLKLI